MYNLLTYRVLQFATCLRCAEYCAELSTPADSRKAHRGLAAQACVAGSRNEGYGPPLDTDDDPLCGK